MAVVAAVFVFAFAMSGLAQVLKPGSPRVPSNPTQLTSLRAPSAPGTLFIPKSSQTQTPPAGHRFAANTNVEVFIPHGLNPDETPPFPNYGYETPASLGCHYGLVSGGSATAACNPNSTVVDPTGGSKTIAIVDAYDDPAAPGDLAWFSLQFGLPLSASQFQVVWANTANSSCPVNLGDGVPTDYSGGWELEESLDIEWAHAMAPSANIYLVEACSNYDSDLQQAVLVANNLVQCGQTEINPTSGVLVTCPAGSTGLGEVSMSWGGSEFAGENASDSCATLDDSCFTAPGVVYFAATGDGPGVIWPSTSPNVVSAGGTTIRRDPGTFNFLQETAWVFSGGGVSAIEPKPSYQSPISNNPTASRGVPDLSFDSDPYTGVYVYDTFPVDGIEYYEWLIVGGTSVSAQALAGIVNRAGSFAASSNAEITNIYNNRTNTAAITDITVGYCGYYMGFPTLSHWDYCTGVGVPNGYTGK
jgi:subtilase family serine protease